MKTNQPIRIVLGTLSVAATLALAGCGEAVEDSALFREQQKIVARLDDDTKVLARHLDEISMTLETISQEVREVKMSPQNASNGVQDLDLRLKTIEAQMADLHDTVRGKVMNLAKLELEMTNKDSGGEAVASADKADSGRTVQGRVTKSSGAAPAPAKPAKSAGTYYKVKDGDTAEQVAALHKISVNDLLTANHIPSGGRLLPGQSIYVPGASN